MPDRAKDQDREEDEDEDLVREAWADARFSTDQALLHSGGGGLLTSRDQVSPYELARRELRALLNRHLHDAALESALDDWIDLHRQPIEAHTEAPVNGLLEILEDTLRREGLFVEFVRTVDVHHGQIMQERPIFQQPGDPPHPDDPHTFDSVRQTLAKLADACRQLA